jgi:hypothetical protein
VDWMWIANVLSLVLLLVIAVFVLWVKPYFTKLSTEVGKIDAMHQRINELTDVAQAKGYGEEKGKRLATHEDIENVLRELKLVTTETELIKAQISGDLWNRQTAWTHRLVAYSAAMGGMLNVRHRLLRLSFANEDWGKEPGPDSSKIESAMTSLTEELTRYNQLTSAAILVGDDAVGQILRDSHSAIALAFNPHPRRVEVGIKDLDKHFIRFVEVARAQLKLQP